MSTCVNDGTVNVMRAGNEKVIHSVVNFSNCNIGGVDKSDQMLTSYEIERKRVKQMVHENISPYHQSGTDFTQVSRWYVISPEVHRTISS